MPLGLRPHLPWAKVVVVDGIALLSPTRPGFLKRPTIFLLGVDTQYFDVG